MNASTSARSNKGLSQFVLILGGSGFIGTRLAQLLTEHSIPFRIGDLVQSQKYPQSWHQCDVTRLDSVRDMARGAFAIINLAAAHRDDVRPLSKYREVNVLGAIHACEAARETGVQKVIFTSSAAVYGFHSQAIDENGPFEPFNEYGRTKLEAEGVYRKWGEEDSARTIVIVRPTVVFGEGNRGNVYNLMRQIESGNFLMVGSGENVKSIAYVGNVAAFLEHCLTLGRGVHISNYVDGPDLNTRELVARIQRNLGLPERVRKLPTSLAMGGAGLFDLMGRVTGRTFPISALRIRKFCETTQFKADRVAQWGFTPRFSLEEGIMRTVQAEFRKQ